MSPVILVEDDEALRVATAQMLELAGFEVTAFPDAETALPAITRDFAGAIVSDIRMPRIDGLELLRRVRAIDPQIPVLLVTGHGDVAMAVQALHDGAADFLTKPFSGDHLAAAVRRSIDHRALGMENRHLRALAAAAERDDALIGESAPMQHLRRVIAQLAKADIDVLIEGETGTGKELVAIMLHRQGPRRAQPFIAVNCGALPEGLAEIELFGHAADSVSHTRLARAGQIATSHGGTLLLDEIDSMPLPLQARLLRVLEEREVQPIGADRPVAVDLHIVATSKADLAIQIAEGRFRADLYYRLSTARVRVPPLRERGEDVLALFGTFVEEAKAQFGVTEWALDRSARERLRAYDWPGNVRELRNFAREVVLGLSEHPTAPPVSHDGLVAMTAAFEASIITAALRHHKGKVVNVLKDLRIPRKTFYYKVAHHRIVPGDFR